MNTEYFPPIPPDTSKVASAVFGKSNFYITIGDLANQLFEGFITKNSTNQPLTSRHTQAMLYLITIFQIMETLPDQLAAQAVRNRVDWKYALHLPLNYPGQQASTLCDFRKQMLIDPAGERRLQSLIARINEVTEAAGSPCFNLKYDDLLSYICLISRVLDVFDAFSRVLETLATQQIELLRYVSLPHWYKRYTTRQKTLISKLERPQLVALAQAIGDDVHYLMQEVQISQDDELLDLPEIANLRRVWQAHYRFQDGKWIWRNNDCAHCSLSSSSNLFL
jgi:transposase